MLLNDSINKGNKEEKSKGPFETSHFNFSSALFSLGCAGAVVSSRSACSNYPRKELEFFVAYPC